MKIPCSKCRKIVEKPKHGRICRPCKREYERTTQSAIRRAQASGRVAKSIDEIDKLEHCGREYDPIVCPMRQRLALQRAVKGLRVPMKECYGCKVNYETVVD